MEDTEILALYFSRSELAITETAKKYGAYIQKIAFNILHSHEDSEEVAEDVYMAAWGTIPPQKPAVFKHFLARIARNLSFDKLDYLTAKRRDPHLILLLSELDACIPDPRANVEQHLERKRTGQILNQFLSTLGKDDCAIFLCRYFYCMTIQQVAQKYNLPERTVKYRLSRLRQKLRKSLEKEDIFV